MGALQLQPSFYNSTTESPREDILHDYMRFLDIRNGGVDPSKGFVNRDAWLKDASSTNVRHSGHIDPEQFKRNFVSFASSADLSKKATALLAFTKVNAGEAYGVKVVTTHRLGHPPTGELIDTLERILGHEEVYHTKILVGATEQFGLEAPTDGWKPYFHLRLLIGSLAYVPNAIFHPILLASEYAGVFAFNWLLNRVSEVFADEPALKETMEARLVEILVDEVGHITFNRMMVGKLGMDIAKAMAPHVADSTTGLTPEFRALGWTKETIKDFDRFDYAALPEEVRKRAFFA